MDAKQIVAVKVIARPEADLAACLEALERAGVQRPAVVRIGPDGAAMTRNRALAGCDAEVLALVEDDVLVEPGWLDALAGAWAGADEALACAGGPLRARFPEGRPEWLSDDLLDALATLDLGSEPLAVDPLERTFHGGNVSFRTSALRGVGGFWPSRGHRDTRDWFSEEHEAQRELARSGWHAAYVPEAGAVRVVGGELTRRAVLRRRLRYGAREALIGRRVTAGAAARQLATSAAGTPLALVRGESRLAMERATRVAESVGALLARPLAQGDLQPVARETPFRASVPPPGRRGLPALRRRREREGPVILLYHRVADRSWDPLGVCVSPTNFARQVEVVKATRELVSLTEIASGDAPPGAVALTFDDGYLDNLEHAAPALAAAGVPATLFVSTGHVAEARSFWWDELEHILLAAPREAASSLTLALAGQRRAFRVGSEEERRSARKHLHAWLQPLAPEEIGPALELLREWAGEAGAGVEPLPALDRAMTPDDLRTFVGVPGLTAGAHSRSHRSLRHADGAVQEAEIGGSRDDLTEWLGHAPTAFSYPFGVPGADVDDSVAARVRAAGFSIAVTTSPGALPQADRFMLPRRVVPDLDGEAFELWLRAPAAA